MPYYRSMRRVMKFLHTMGAAGLIGAMGCLLALLAVMPAPTATAAYAAASAAAVAIAKWILLPSLGLTLIAGLVAIAVNPVFHNAGWAWLKAASGVLMFEWCFVGVIGPLEQEADLGAQAVAGGVDPATLALTAAAERNSIWILLAVATANVAVGIWRPRLVRVPD